MTVDPGLFYYLHCIVRDLESIQVPVDPVTKFVPASLPNQGKMPVHLASAGPEQRQNTLAMRLADNPDHFNRRTIRLLATIGIHTVDDLCRRKPSELINIKGFGMDSYGNVSEFLDNNSLSLRSEK